ncbi:aldo/keto reductase [Plantibacter flavus]|uniref:aldo/keto reductase n=1 Tax=Plantibacter flavus TaxID=150123 RepID=UPI003F144F0E
MSDVRTPTALPTTTIGPADEPATVGAIGYGAMSIAGTYGAIADADVTAVLDASIEAGANLIDTANVYGDGRSEQLLGRYLAGRRDDVVLASKVGIVNGGGIGKRGIRGDRAYIHEQIDLSLGRLGTDHLDLYYQHRVDPNIPIEETVGALAELVTAGKIRRIGLSEATGDELRRAHAVHPIAAIQSEWSIVSRDIETYVVPTAAELGVTVVAFSPLSRGLFTDSFGPEDVHLGGTRANFPRFQPEHLGANLELAAHFRSLAHRLGTTSEALAIAWVHDRAEQLGARVVSIPGTRSVAHLHANFEALQLELSDETRAEIDGYAARVSGPRASDPNWVSGGREGLI